MTFAVRFAVALLATVFFAVDAPAQVMPVVSGEPAQAPKEAVPPKLRIAQRTPAARFHLSPVREDEVAAVRRANEARAARKRLAIGVNRPMETRADLPSVRDMTWTPVAGGRAAQVAVRSPEAGSLRVAIDLAGVPLDVEMVFYGSDDPQRLFGPVRVGDIADRSKPWWSPVTEGETQTVEFFVPQTRDSHALGPEVVAVSHLFTTPSSNFAKRLQDIGQAGGCNVDAMCSPLAASPAYQNAMASVAQMVFNDGGFTVLCTGTLVNDNNTSTQTPWFMSNNHCFDNSTAPFKSAAEMQSVANTLNTLWRFESSACGSTTPNPAWSQVTGGATFIYNHPHSDVMLLRLNQPPPAGAYYSGWDANALGAGNSVIAIHHPAGDLKKVSEGSVLGHTPTGVAGGSTEYIEVRWSSGTTEQGSSGGGLWTFDGSQYRFRGGLWGGVAACTNPGGSDYYSRFDLVYPQLATYLGGSNVPIANFTDLWWNPSESGWGLSLIQHPSNIIFGVWYTYDAEGKRTWIVMPSGTWTNSRTFSGPLYKTAGPPFISSFDPNDVDRRVVGSATLTFSDANNGTWAWTIDGQSGTKTISRQPF